MDDLVNRVTVIRRDGSTKAPRAQDVYVQPKKEGRPKVSFWSRPLEKGARRMLKAQVIFAQEALKRHDDSGRRRRDGWLLEGPANIAESGRKALNEARKAVPFKFIPKV
jgi:hypothetical protein